MALELCSSEWSPQSVPLRHTDHFELKTTEAQRLRKSLYFPFNRLKEFYRRLDPGRELSPEITMKNMS